VDVIEVTTEHGLFGKIVRDDNGVVLVNPPELEEILARHPFDVLAKGWTDGHLKTRLT
jgi:hypothetical protein